MTQAPSAGGIENTLALAGLVPLGRFEIDPDDIADPGHAHLAGRQALLVGNAGDAMWNAFSQSPEAGDGKPDPLDRWTRRTVDAAVAPIGRSAAICLYPFGDPVWPFQRWAKRAMGIKTSPLGLLIHPDYGLWFALRAALVLGEGVLGEGVLGEGVLGEGEAEKLIQDVEKVNHPCDDCFSKRCLTACPVDAFSSDGFAAGACRSYLDSTPWQHNRAQPDCSGAGCAARNACPAGPQWRYSDPQLRFHMAAFRG